jgi:hypothetical protein
MCKCAQTTRRAEAFLVVDPPALDFGAHAPPEQQTKSVTLTNSGDRALSFSSIAIEGDATIFQLGTVPMQLDVGAVATIDVTFVPPSTEGAQGATLVIDSDAANAPEVRVSLSGRSLCTGDHCNCTPATCASLAKACGTWPDGCGSMVSCPACADGQTCTDGACGCAPTTCEVQGKVCGSISDGCGGTLMCGTCSSGACVNGQCACVKTTCEAQGKNCGSIPDGCGGMLMCGSCQSGLTCGGCGVANVCTPGMVQAPSRLCTADRWCWENPLPQGNTLHAVWPVSATDTWFAGDRGALFRRGPNGWAGVHPGTVQDLYGLWAHGGTDVWIVGTHGTNLRYDGTSWTSQWDPMYPPPDTTFFKVWGYSTTARWVVGLGETMVRQGIDWPGFGPLTSYGVWGSSANEVFVFGTGGFSTDGICVNSGGLSLSSCQYPTMQTLYDGWGTGTTDVRAAGGGGTIVQYDGSNWTVAPTQTTAQLNSIWGSSATDWWATGATGTMLHAGGTTWSAPVTVPTTSDLNLIRGTGSSDVYAVGTEGTILHYDGGTWSDLSSGSRAALLGVFASSGCGVWAVGRGGAVMYSDGVTWAAQPSPTSVDLYAVWSDPLGNVFAVGDQGTLVLLGATQSMTNVGTDILRAVWGTTKDDVWAVGDEGTLLHFNGQMWTKAASPTAQNLYAVSGSAANDVWAVGDIGTTLHFDGNTWHTVSSPVQQALHGVAALPGAEVWAVGDQGTVMHWTSSSWSAQTVGSATFVGVWAAPQQTVSALTVDGHVANLSATQPTFAETGCAQPMRALNGVAGAGLWAVGDEGAVLHLAP